MKATAQRAERKLAEHITRKARPPSKPKRRYPNKIKIADALSVYMEEKIAEARPKAGIAMVENLGDFFGERTIGELNGPATARLRQAARIPERGAA